MAGQRVGSGLASTVSFSFSLPFLTRHFGPAGKQQPMEEATPEAADGLMGDDAAARERVLKFEVQMYRLRDGEYVVDFQVGRPAASNHGGNQGHLRCASL